VIFIISKILLLRLCLYGSVYNGILQQFCSFFRMSLLLRVKAATALSTS